MKKTLLGVLLAGAVLFIGFLPITSAIASPHAGFAIIIGYFFFLCPIYFVISGGILSRYIKKLWYMPMVLNLIFGLSAWNFTKSTDIFTYSIGYLPLCYIAMLVGYFTHRKEHKAEESAKMEITDLD